MIRKFQFLNVFLYVCLSAIIFFAITSLSDGHFTYSLDDPYIHLSVAENILQGGYGVNLSEFSSPSSSILYPYLLAFTLLCGLGVWGPLLLALPAQGISIWLLSGEVGRAVFRRDEEGSSLWWPMAVVLGLAVLISINSLGLPFTGMEHSLQVLATLATVLGLMRVERGEEAPAWLPVAIVIGPLLRFEGYALAGLALLALLWFGKRKLALVTGSILAVLTLGYILLMSSRGLPVFPSSVLVKSKLVSATATSASGNALVLHIIEAVRSFKEPWAPLFALTSTALCAVIAFPKSKALKVSLGVIVGTLAAHVLAGKYGWFGRYEVYCAALMFVGWSVLTALTPYTQIALWMRIPLATAAILFACTPYVHVTSQTPGGANNIYTQQYQMHRFATEFFPHPVAVNDLGYVAFENERYVLDLWGLGSEKARQIHQSDQPQPPQFDALAREHEVAFAMVYDTWFAQGLPQQWCKVAHLTTSAVSAGHEVVSFYLIERERSDEMTSALQSFSDSLPSGSDLEIFPCEGAD